jgi:hypothetical protein
VNRHDFIAAPKLQGRKQAGNAEHMVEMAVGQHDPVDPSEAGAAAQQLTLRSLAAINQDAITSCLDEKSRLVTPVRRNACRRAEEGECKHQA